MSTRLYVGNLPQNFDQKELEGMFAAVGAGVRFKAVLDRDTGVCRGFGFVNLDDPKLTDAVIEQFNNREYGGNQLRDEVSDRRDSRNNDRGGDRRRGPGGGPAVRARASTRWCTASPLTKKLPIPAGLANSPN